MGGIFLIMQSWLNWYSTGLEIRHPERVSGFESLALRYAPMAKLEDAPDLGRKSSSGRLLCADRNGVKTDAVRHEGSSPVGITKVPSC